MIWDKLLLLEWFIRGLVSVNCIFCCLAAGFFFFSFVNFHSLFCLDSKRRMFFCLFNTLIKLLHGLIQAYHC